VTPEAAASRSISPPEAAASRSISPPEAAASRSISPPSASPDVDGAVVDGGGGGGGNAAELSVYSHVFFKSKGLLAAKVSAS
jgi:hypothetical protein